MHMFPFGRVIYVPFSSSSSSTLVGPIPSNFSPSSTVSLYNPTLVSNSLNVHTTSEFEQQVHQQTFPRRFKRTYQGFQDEHRKKQHTLSSRASKNSLMLLHEIKPSVEYTFIGRTGPSHRPIFTMAVEVNGQVFQGTAQTKKEAKQAAAEKALRSLSDSTPSSVIDSHDIRKDCNPLSLPKQPEKDCVSKEMNNSLSAERDFADRLAKCIQDKFHRLTEKNVSLRRRKVLSGIVLTRNSNLESMEIICVTTGSKSLNYDQFIPNEQTLNDCHAEILARRCLIRYCYEQLNVSIDGKTNPSIFERIDGTHRFRLQANIAFHLYISKVPCGDSRLFSLQDLTSEKRVNEDIEHPLRQSRGLLRMKIPDREGTIPISARSVCQSRETRRLTMSCSDKFCRWNFIGLQGALLSVLIEPIYYTNIIIGSLHHDEQIQRALFSRIEHLADQIPAPYGLRRPFISGVSHPEMRSTTRAPNHAFVWNCIDEEYEVIDSLSGLTTFHEPSTISKTVLFQQWLDLTRKIQLERVPTMYCEAKQLAVNYQLAKTEVNGAFQKGGFGVWISEGSDESV